MKKNTCVTEHTAEAIREMLFSGTYHPGDKLPSETKMASDLGIGRSSVREALRLLAASGYVELIPNRGAFAAVTCEEDLPSPQTWLEINRDMVSELLALRMCIEPFAAELCARHITPEALGQLHGLLMSFSESIARGEVERRSLLDYEFHRLILKQSHNRYLASMYEPLLEAFMQYSRRSNIVSPVPQNTLSEHYAVYNAIAAHAPEEARAAMELHLSIAIRRLREGENAGRDTQ